MDVSSAIVDDTTTNTDATTTTTNDTEKPSGVERPVSYSNPERPSLAIQPSITNPPTASPVITTTAQDELPQSLSSIQTSSWTELLSDDFQDSFGIFHPGSTEYVTYYPYVKERHGVLRIQHGQDMRSSIYSDNIALLEDASSPTMNRNSNSNSRMIKVVFSYYANSMEIYDGFCIDTSVDDGNSWHSQKCWHAETDFTNGSWYDDSFVAFELKEHQDNVVDGSFRIRFRCKGNSDKDDVLFDKVKVLQELLVAEETRSDVLKDSKQ
mmetsp:Transcript_14801/g.32152  ORF Transcript_14801/g.32152 Transcript_14801/m.32152 type:complete len:267 (+) Transcript_14801:3-803(+)